MSDVEVSLKPLGREEIQQLEAVLLVGTVSRPDVIEKMRTADPRDRVTWIDSLAVAAGALAREKAGMPVTRIADELGRGEQAIRAHLSGKTEAGKIIREPYEMLLRGEKILPFVSTKEFEKIKEELEKERKARQELQAKLESVVNALEDILARLKT